MDFLKKNWLPLAVVALVVVAGVVVALQHMTWKPTSAESKDLKPEFKLN